MQFTGLPFFAPEMFQAVEVADPLRAKQLKHGLAQLGEEGAIQVFRPHLGGSLLLGAVGQLQFEVVLHRLEHEYGVKARLSGTKQRLARWVTAESPGMSGLEGERELKRFIDFYAARIAYDAVDAPTYMATHQSELRVAAGRVAPKIKFHALREHAGLVFQTGLAA